MPSSQLGNKSQGRPTSMAMPDHVRGFCQVVPEHREDRHPVKAATGSIEDTNGMQVFKSSTQARGSDKMYDLHDLREILERHAAHPSCETVIPGLKLMRSEKVSSCMIAAVYSPMIGIMVRGAKYLVVGDTTLEYKAGDFLVSSVDLPVSAKITEATPDQPYLALALTLDPQLLASVWLELPNEVQITGPRRGVAVGRCPPELMESFVRLVRLLDSPTHTAHLGPLVLREIYYRLLTSSEHADMLHQMVLPKHRLPQREF